MFCQLCGASNDDEATRCRSCGHKLLVVSGQLGEEEQHDLETDPEGQLSFDEHLLERVSILEEVVKRTAQAMRKGLGTLHLLEQKILLNHSGLLSLRQVLDETGLVERTRWTELWESRLDRQLLALEKRDRFADVRERVADLYSGQDSGAFRSLLDEAERAFASYKLDRALAALEEARRLDGGNHELEYFLAETYFNEGDRREALGRFLRVLELRPGHLESLIYAGVLRHQDGDEDAARELLVQAAEQHPDAFLPRFALGAMLFLYGHHEMAADRLAEAVDCPGAAHQAWYLLGCAELECGRPQRALEALEVASQLEPDSPEVRLALAVAYLDRGWRRKAAEAARIACDLRPMCLEYRELVELLRPDGQHLERRAVEALQRAEEAIFAGDTVGAVSAYRAAVHEDPENALVHVAYAMACIELDRLSEVEPAVSYALELEPGDDLRAAARATLLEALRAERRNDDAARLARHYLDQTLDQDQSLGEASQPGASDYARGLMSLELGLCLATRPEDDVAVAVDHLHRAEELLDDGLERFALAARGWALVSCDSGSADEALRCLRRANELGSSARILMQLGVAALAAGDTDQAREAFVGARRERERGGLPERLLEALRDVSA